MQKYLCMHTLPANALTAEQINQFAQAAQHDPQVRGYRSFASLSEGKVACIMEAQNRDALAAWFKKMNMPFDSISPVELEGDRGIIHEEMRVGTA